MQLHKIDEWLILYCFYFEYPTSKVGWLIVLNVVLIKVNTSPKVWQCQIPNRPPDSDKAHYQWWSFRKQVLKYSVLHMFWDLNNGYVMACTMNFVWKFWHCQILWAQHRLKALMFQELLVPTEGCSGTRSSWSFSFFKTKIILENKSFNIPCNLCIMKTLFIKFDQKNQHRKWLITVQ